MTLGVFVLTVILTSVYLYKVFLHYKLLRIEKDGQFNEDEDYFLSFWLKNENWIFKAKGGSIEKITDHFHLKESVQLKEKINSLIQIVWIGSIVWLIGILIYLLI